MARNEGRGFWDYLDIFCENLKYDCFDQSGKRLGDICVRFDIAWSSETWGPACKSNETTNQMTSRCKTVYPATTFSDYTGTICHPWPFRNYPEQAKSRPYGEQ